MIRAIHSIGDSHSRFSFAGIPGVVYHQLGPVTMKRIGRAHPRGSAEDCLLPNTVASIADLGPDDLVVLSCGEGDVRCFIHPRLAAGADEELELQGMVDLYLDQAAKLELRGARLAILAIPPPTTTWRGGYPPFMPTGTDQERAGWTRSLNQRLAAGCAARGFLFLDIYSRYVGPDGLLIVALSDNSVHIGKTGRVRELLAELELLPEVAR